MLMLVVRIFNSRVTTSTAAADLHKKTTHADCQIAMPECIRTVISNRDERTPDRGKYVDVCILCDAYRQQQV